MNELRKWLAARGWSQAALCRTAGLPATTLSEIVRGRRKASPAMEVRIRTAMKKMEQERRKAIK